jgi:hypothetical protein
MIFPIGFAIPECKIVNKIPEKKQLLSSLIPGVLSTYKYQTEESYREEYKQSLFALTCRKAGWDCMRHYEILACGSIPLFVDIQRIPSYTMSFFPKELVSAANNELVPLMNTTPLQEIVEKAQPYIEKLLEYTKTHLTTKALAKYTLNNICPDAKNVLFLSNQDGVDYMRCLLLHGLKEVLGVGCEEWSSVDHLYKDFPDKYVKELYGKGFHVTQLLNSEVETILTPSSILEGLVAKKWDCVIYASVHRGTPFLQEVIEAYPPEKIAFVCGEDEHNCPYVEALVKKGHPFFLREIPDKQ